jgi:hypothetical protein
MTGASDGPDDHRRPFPPRYTCGMSKISTTASRGLSLLAFLAIITLLPCLAAGCKSEAQLAEEATWRMDTPLPHDPMDRDVLGAWWSNGDELLNLRADGAYVLYDNNNRYGRPLERGRWGQRSYAVLTLEPYTRLEREPTRVSITKMNGALTLLVPQMQPMRALTGGPPTTREDELIGQWQGTIGLLQLNADLTYAFVPAPGAAPAGGAPVIAGHNGRWSLEGDRIGLMPGTPSIAPISLTVKEATPASPGEGTAPAPERMLQGLGGDLVKVKAAQA